MRQSIEKIKSERDRESSILLEPLKVAVIHCIMHTLKYMSILCNDNDLCPHPIMFPTALMLQIYTPTEVW